MGLSGALTVSQCPPFYTGNVVWRAKKPYQYTGIRAMRAQCTGMCRCTSELACTVLIASRQSAPTQVCHSFDGVASLLYTTSLGFTYLIGGHACDTDWLR